MTHAKHIDEQGTIHCTRRTFGKIALSGVAGMGAFVNSSAPARAQTKDLPGPPNAGDYVSHMKDNPSNLKLGMDRIPSNPSHEDLMYARQFGVEWVCINAFRGEQTAEGYIEIVNQLAKYGLKIWRLGNQSLHNVDAITLNLPNRDEKVDEYIQYLRNLQKAGIMYTTYAHMADSVWSTRPQRPIRGGIAGKTFRWSDGVAGRAGTYKGKMQRFPDKPIHGRVYTEQEIWDNYEYFIRKVAPVAEECNVRIGIHPDDPPLPMLGGVPRCIFSSFEGYRRAMEIADSPNVGLCLCVGCWLEGGDRMGKNVLETIQYFGKRNKLFKVHVRNTDSQLSHTNPTFSEAWIDDGYMDMYKVMRELRIVNNDCLIIDDHHPPGTIGGRMVGKAFQLGYIRALLERANEEVG